MAKKLDPLLIEILRKYGEDANEALWDCHGTWVVYHKAIERIAARAGVAFDMPQIIEARSAEKTVAIAVRGVMGERSEWSFGEAAPSNNKNAYPYAMAEKRAKDRVVLKLVGLHGLAYSEEESDDFKAPAEPATKSSAQLKRENAFEEFERELDECKTLVALEKFRKFWGPKTVQDGWTAAWKSAAKDRIEGREKAIMDEVDRLSEATDEELANTPVRETLNASLNVLGAG